MTPDDYLERLLDAVEKSNYWDVEAYAQKILDQIHKVKPSHRATLQPYLEGLIKEAQAQHKKQRDKEDLINQIMKPKK